MSTRLQNPQPDLLHRAAKQAERERLPPDVQARMVVLLKQLLRECAPDPMETRPVDE
jgi:hypothetical protein